MFRFVTGCGLGFRVYHAGACRVVETQMAQASAGLQVAELGVVGALIPRERISCRSWTGVHVWRWVGKGLGIDGEVAAKGSHRGRVLYLCLDLGPGLSPGVIYVCSRRVCVCVCRCVCVCDQV